MWTSTCNLVYKDDQEDPGKLNKAAAEIWDTIIQKKLKHLRQEIGEDLKDTKKVTSMEEKLLDCLKHTKLRTRHSIEQHQRTLEWIKIMNSHIVYARTFSSCSNFSEFISSAFEIKSLYDKIKQIPIDQWLSTAEFGRLKHYFGKHFSLLDDESEREKCMQILFIRFPELAKAFQLECRENIENKVIDLITDELPRDLTREDSEKEKTSNGRVRINKSGDEQDKQNPILDPLKRKLPEPSNGNTTIEATKRKKLIDGASKKNEPEKKSAIPFLLN